MNLPMADLAWDKGMLTISLQNIKPSVLYREAQIEENGKLSMWDNIPHSHILNQSCASVVYPKLPRQKKKYIYITYTYKHCDFIFLPWQSLSYLQLHMHTQTP